MKNKMKVTMLVSINGSDDGIGSRMYIKGGTYTVGEKLYDTFIKHNYAKDFMDYEKGKMETIAPENKMESVTPENKQEDFFHPRTAKMRKSRGI
jgi:hypothetical protein